MYQLNQKMPWFSLTLVGLFSISCVDYSQNESIVETPQNVAKSASDIDPQLRAKMIATTQAGADDRYHAEQRSLKEAWLNHGAQAFEATFDGKEMRLASTNVEPWNLTISLSDVGCADAVRAVRDGSVEITNNRVDLVREDVREWYVNGPLGLEQGFTLDRAPTCQGTKAISMAIGGSVSPELALVDSDGRGRAISFVNADGETIANYTDLYAKDAAGKPLPTWMSVDAGNVSLYVDDTEAAYPIEIDPLIWVEQAKFVVADGVQGDVFGWSIAMSDDTALVGARGYEGKGAAFVFVRNGSNWSLQQKLIASDGATSDSFGWSVALSGDTALIGARGAAVGANSNQGAAYVFVRNGDSWTEQAKLFASDGDNDDEFAWSVALSGDTALIGAWRDDIMGVVDQGSAYVFTRNGAVWSEAQPKLTASDGKTPDSFGWSVALLGNTAFIGAPSVDVGANMNQGAAYVFVRNNGIFAEQTKLAGSAGAVKDSFGFSFSLAPDTALIGTGFANSAYTFTLNNNAWTEQQRLVANGGSAMGDSFGNSVALSGDLAIMGAFAKTVGANAGQGSAYVFARNGNVWTEQAELTASDGAANDNFGSSVGLSGDTAFVGAHLADPGGNTAQGATYVFALRRTNGETCGSAIECASGFCVDGVCCDTACGDGDTTDCQACSIAKGASADGACAPVAKGTECRKKTGECDAAETCDGAAVECPADSSIPDGAQCSGGTCAAGVCSSETGSGGSAGAGGIGGAGGTGANGSGAGGNDAVDPSGCNCRFGGRNEDQSSIGVIVSMAFIALRGIRRRFTTQRA
jgi:hypothetical protein